MRRSLSASRSRKVRPWALCMAWLGLLAGCGGGAPTTQNPDTNAPPVGADYLGPPPATADIQAFRVSFWENIRPANRCGTCHDVAGAQSPLFARGDDVNLAYQQVGAFIDREVPGQSALVTKVAGGHNCWLSDANACAGIITRWIQDWVGSDGGGGRQIELVPPPLRDPGASKRLGATPPPQFNALYNLLAINCSSCHQANAPTAQQPYFAAGGVPGQMVTPSPEDYQQAYTASIARINLDAPADSRFVVRLRRDSHNCWSASCTADADALQAAIQALSDAIPVTALDPQLLVSKALTLQEGTVASGGSRFDSNVVALYEFKTGQGATAFDTSGVDPAADLRLTGDYAWVGGWGIDIRSGKAQASTGASAKLQRLIGVTGEYSLEAWVAPGNVTQEDARIISYSGSATARNFTLGQTLYSYEFHARSSATDNNGTPLLVTDPDAQQLQATLQHVVLTYDPVNGRRIYINGEFSGAADPVVGGTLDNWDDSFALVLGNEVSNDRQWTCVLRLVAIHNRALTPAQVQQNFAAGVGEKFFLLFGVEQLSGMPDSYVLFETTQFDSFGYLFDKPRFISLNADARPGSISLRGMRIAVNGTEPLAGQAYRLLNVQITDADYSPGRGQALSEVGTIIPLEQGPSLDEFHLCFDQLGERSNVCSTFAQAQPTGLVDVPRAADVGVRTFDAINASMASLTGVSANDVRVRETFASVRQSLPAQFDIQAYLSSHQTAVSQLALQYCSVLVDDAARRTAFFRGVDFNSPLAAGGAASTALVDALVTGMVGAVNTQPTAVQVGDELNALIGRLCSASGGTCNGQRTLDVAKAACGATLGSAVILVQ